MHNINDVDVVIVGAGLAGLAAALELKKKNYSFVVIEARNRYGGRLHSIVTDNGVTIDLGAQWVGSNHKRLKRLIADFDLHTTPTYTKGKTIFQVSGKKRNGKGKIPPLSPIGLLDMLNLKRKINKLIKQIPAKTPWTSLVAHELDKQTIDSFIQTNMFSQEGRTFYGMVVEEALCAKLYEVSALNLLWCIKTTDSGNYLLEAENEWIVEGAQVLADRIAESLGNNIIYHSPVEQIIYDKDFAIVHTANNCWKAQKVIIAIPPNLSTRIKFSPPLPAQRIQLSDRAGLASVIKMIFVYEQPFWRKDGLNGKVYSDQSPVKLIMDSSPPHGRKGVLTVLITGECARLMGTMEASTRQQKVIKALVYFFGTKASHPQSVYEKNWSEDEWTRGGYGTHFATGVLTQFGTALTEPVSSLYWAGTETATEWRTYMEGAVQSGQNIAIEVISTIR